MHPSSRLTTIGMACATLSSQALAQSEPLTLPPVTVTSHYDTAVGSSDAASQGRIRGDLITDIPLLRPGEVLENVPGLVVTQHSGDGKANQYFLRGYNLDHGTDFSTSIDGVPVNMPTNAHGQGYSDLNYLIPELVERIDYRKGPYFADSGDFSAAGSADIQYRSHLEHGLADLTLGGFGYKRALLANSAALTASPKPSEGSSPLINTGATLMGALELLENNGPWSTKENMKKVNGLLRLSDGSRANGWSVDGLGYCAQWNSTDQVPLALIQSGQLGRFSALDPTDGGDTGRAILSGEWHRHDDDGYDKVSFFAQHYRLKLWSDFTFYELRPDTGDQFEQVEQRNIVGGKLAHGWTSELFGHDSITEVGLQLRHDQIHVGLLNTQDRIPFETVSDDVVGETEAGLYAQNSTTWLPWMRTLLGLRSDSINMSQSSRTSALNSGHASATQLSPKASAILGPWASTEFFVNAGRGFHSNDARGVIDKVDPTTGGPASAVPALVSAKGEEIGVRTQAIDGLQSSLALWRLDSDSELIYNADSDIGSSSPNGASKRIGVEWNNHWIVNSWLLVDADLAATRARYAQDNDNGATGNSIPNAVSHVGVVRVTLTHVGPWSAGLETRYIGSYPLSQDGTLVAPSATTTNFKLRRQLSHGCDISVDALNVFNRKYYDIAYEQDYRVARSSPIVPTGVTVHPGEPRQARVTLSVRF